MSEQQASLFVEIAIQTLGAIMLTSLIVWALIVLIYWMTDNR